MGHLIAEAIFASTLQPSELHTVAEYREAVRLARRCCGGSVGCAAAMADEFGAHPETAITRMRWALTVESQVDRRRKAVAA